jgi:TolA-binding protein
MKSHHTYDPFPAVDEISSYLKGSLPAEKAAAVKMAAANDALVAEALEGFALQPDALQMIPPVYELSQTLAASKVAGGIGKFFLWKLNTVFSLISVGAGLTAVVGYFIFKDQASGNTTALYQSVKTQLEEPVSETVLSNQTLVLDSVKAIVLPSEKERIAVAIPEVMQPLHRAAPKMPEMRSERRDMSMMPATAMMPSEANRVAILVTNYNGLRIADYSPLRPATWKLNNGEQVGYIAFLQEALNWHLQGKYEQSAAVLEQILSIYPEDVNAQYYLGMNNLLLGKYESASTLFEGAAENRISSFRHEAHFYNGKCLARLGRTDEANQIFERAIRRGGNLKEMALREME